MSPKPHPGVLQLKPYVGGEAKAPGANRVVRLASNENPLGASPKAAEAHRALSGELHRYPDGGAEELRRALAKSEGLAAERIVCGAGSDELIALLLKAYCGPGDEVLYSAHGFLMYPIGAQAVGATPVAVPEKNLEADLEAILAAVTPRTRAVFLANPNNPTGALIAEAALADFAKRLPRDVLFVIDAAYAEYVESADYDPGSKLVERHDNVVMLRTFSKIHGLAALRLGWAYAQDGIVDVLNRVRGPFNVSAAAQAAGVAALSDGDFIKRSIASNSREKKRLADGLTALGLKPQPSQGNFILVRFPGGAAAAEAALKQLKQDGILVRAMAGYGLADCLRITVGLTGEVDAVLTSIKAWASLKGWAK